MNVKNTFTLNNLLKLSILCCSGILLVILFESITLPEKHAVEKKKQIALRAIGDQLLRQSEEFEHPVPPLTEIDEHTLRLNFNTSLCINPDVLADLALKYVSPEITSRAIFNLIELESKELVYAFEINYRKSNEIPCIGRTLPLSEYALDVSFYDDSSIHLGVNVFTLCLLGLVLFSVAKIRTSFSKSSVDSNLSKPALKVKGVTLNGDNNILRVNNRQIKLTNKETQIFSLLLKNEGRLLSRDYLTEEVWLKEGVVTGRSLDMYISRLRKKTKDYSLIRILNQHGKGYTLHID